MYNLQPLANGTHTDHPIPDLPFVDDSHIPVHDERAVEAIGRGTGEGMWGREDHDSGWGWRAFTTDPIRHDLAWCVRYHPDHGRSVLLMRDDDAASLHTEWDRERLLYRTGGYWWDGTTWYRPGQVWDAAAEEYDRRAVKAALTVTAADLLDDSADPAGGQIGKVSNVDVKAPPPDRWLDHLARWAAERADYTDALPLNRCVVRFSAPELAGDQLLSIAEMAELAGIAASTLRAYTSRRNAEVPPPQATVGGRSMWSRPVAEDWIEMRRRSPDSVAASMAGAGQDSLSLGESAVRDRFARSFFATLWDHPERRKRWALRHRNETGVHQVADELAWEVGASMRHLVPTDALSATIRHAVLDEFATGTERHESLSKRYGGKHPALEEWDFIGITRPVAHMLDWLIRHFPETAQHTISGIVGEAERRMDIPRAVSANSLRTALGLDGKLDAEALNEFLDRALPPKSH